MLYIKTKTGEKHEITSSNIYTRCPKCGKEVQVDQAALLDAIAQNRAEDMADVSGLSALGQYCQECSDEHAREAAARYEQRVAQFSRR